MTTRDRVIHIIANQMNLDPTKINDADHLIEQIGADEFDLATFRDDFEDTFNIQISDDEWAGCGSIADTVAEVQRHLR